MYGKINCRIDKKRGEKRGEEIGPVCNSIGLIFFDGDEGDIYKHSDISNRGVSAWDRASGE